MTTDTSEARAAAGKMEDGGQAFPCPPDGYDRHVTTPGMSLRDWFAGQALIGIAEKISPDVMDDLANGTRGGRPLALVAYVLADAMIAARKAES